MQNRNSNQNSNKKTNLDGFLEMNSFEVKDNQNYQCLDLDSNFGYLKGIISPINRVKFDLNNNSKEFYDMEDWKYQYNQKYNLKSCTNSPNRSNLKSINNSPNNLNNKKLNIQAFIQKGSQQSLNIIEDNMTGKFLHSRSNSSNNINNYQGYRNNEEQVNYSKKCFSKNKQKQNIRIQNENSQKNTLKNQYQHQHMKKENKYHKFYSQTEIYSPSISTHENQEQQNNEINQKYSTHKHQYSNKNYQDSKLKQNYLILQQQYNTIKLQNSHLKQSKSELMQQNITLKRQSCLKNQQYESQIQKLKQQIYRLEMSRVDMPRNTNRDILNQSNRTMYNQNVHSNNEKMNVFYVEELERQNQHLMRENRRLNQIMMKRLRNMGMQ